MKKISLLLTGLLAALLSGSASAHPAVFHVADAFMAGLMHPLTGLDHLLAMLAVGFWAAQTRQRWLPPAMFVLMMMAGALLALNGLGLPGIEADVEAGIAASVLVLGLLIFFTVRLPATFSLVLISVFALAHGYAHGAEYQGQQGMLQYAGGFLLTTISLHVGGYLAGFWMRAHFYTQLQRCAGLFTAAFGMYLLVSL